MKTRFALAVLAFVALPLHAQSVRITAKPQGLVHGMLTVPVVADEPVARMALYINGVEYTRAEGRVMNAQVHVGEYLRRLRLRAVGWDNAGNEVAQDEMVVNDPRPPFRVSLSAPAKLPGKGTVTLSANVTKPVELQLQGIDFYVGEQKVATAAAAPFTATFDAAQYQNAVYARVAARAAGGEEANDVAFFGDRPSDAIDVELQHIPVSIASGSQALRIEQLRLFDNGAPRHVEALVPAANEPLYVVLLIDYSESMLDELPVVKAAARQFAKVLLRPQDRIAVVGFNQRTFWLTGYTNDFEAAARSVDKVQPAGETHLYDSAIEMLYELQKMPGRHALVLLTDGVDQGSAFKLEHLVHYGRYAGVPIYPIVKNHRLSSLMRFGIGHLEARRLAGIARDTGATYFIIQKERELPAVYQRIADELRQQYQLVFYAAADSADAWHPLRVESSGGQRLRAPMGYFP